MFTIFPVMLLIYVYGFYVNFYLIGNVLTKAGDLGNLGYFYIDKSQRAHFAQGIPLAGHIEVIGIIST